MLDQTLDKVPASLQAHESNTPVVLDGKSLTVDELVRVTHHHAPVSLSEEPAILERMNASVACIEYAVANNLPIYGVTTCFGGMANVVVDAELADALQNNLIRSHKTGVGGYLPLRDVRASMLLRINSHLHGVSGIRPALVDRMRLFLNEGVTPLVHEHGSIGASGDLVPLAYIAGAVIGADPAFLVDFRGERMACTEALTRLGLEPIKLRAKEGLAMINGTSVSTGIAANVLHETQILFSLAMTAHALYTQALNGTNQSFHPFIHAVKAHEGQVWSAATMLSLLEGSRMVRHELDGRHDHRDDHLIQDRYSLRCLPQYMGALVDGLTQVFHHLEIEMNSATDNPLIDPEQGLTYHGGNFLGQYVGMGMDKLRSYLGLCAKHLDVQIAQVMSPEFSFGLPPSLVGNRERSYNVGFKPLQLAGNSMMPLLGFYGNTLVDRFPTHAEQYNQNINSQSFGAAGLARKSLDIMTSYMALNLVMCVQAVELRSHAMGGGYDPRPMLSAPTRELYEAVMAVLDRTPDPERPFLYNDTDRFLDMDVARLADDIRDGHTLLNAVAPTLQSIKSLIKN